MTATIDTAGLERKMRQLRRDEIPTAARNAVRDLMRDVIQRERREMRAVFDRPKPFVVNGLQIIDDPEKVMRPTGIIGFTRKDARAHAAVNMTVKPHIPGYRAERRYKGMEDRLQAAGFISEGQYMVAASTAKTDKYGNITFATIKTMLRNVLGGDRRRAKYVWGTRHTAGGGIVTGIWLRTALKQRTGRALQMLVVNDVPDYAKRFRFHDVARRWSARRAPYHAELAVEHAIRRRNR